MPRLVLKANQIDAEAVLAKQRFAGVLQHELLRLRGLRYPSVHPRRGLRLFRKRKVES